jgi:hypothetical protein
LKSSIAQKKADGLAPPSQADLLRDAVLNGSPATEFDAAFDAYAARRQTH